jgi:hypothetical protein
MQFMLVAKSNYIRKLIMESKEPDLTRIDLSDIPGGPEIFEKAAKFCYGVNFEVTVHNVAALRCAAEYLQMTDKYCDSNLAGRTEDFLSQVALTSLSGAIVVLKSCQDLLPMAEHLRLVQRSVDVASSKVNYCFPLSLSLSLSLSSLISEGERLIFLTFELARRVVRPTFRAGHRRTGGQRNYRS